ncbi:MAG: STAS domain-containing protein [Solirubrobacterales bacterium]|nr:STAS domain-containing protein [Solirubrobacterales bacterium]
MTAPSEFPAPFRAEERNDEDGAVLLILSGELDIAVAELLTRRIHELATARQVIRLDLSQLEFVDSTGLRALIGAVMESERDGFELEIDTEVSGQVQRLIDLAGVADKLWPLGRGFPASEH